MTKIRLSDYVARRLYEHGVRHVFMLTGGGAMHLNDAMGRVDGLHRDPLISAPISPHLLPDAACV